MKVTKLSLLLGVSTLTALAIGCGKSFEPPKFENGIGGAGSPSGSIAGQMAPGEALDQVGLVNDSAKLDYLRKTFPAALLLLEEDKTVVKILVRQDSGLLYELSVKFPSIDIIMASETGVVSTEEDLPVNSKVFLINSGEEKKGAWVTSGVVNYDEDEDIAPNLDSKVALKCSENCQEISIAAILDDPIFLSIMGSDDYLKIKVSNDLEKNQISLIYSNSGYEDGSAVTVENYEVVKARMMEEALAYQSAKEAQEQLVEEDESVGANNDGEGEEAIDGDNNGEVEVESIDDNRSEKVTGDDVRPKLNQEEDSSVQAENGQPVEQNED